MIRPYTCDALNFSFWCRQAGRAHLLFCGCGAVLAEAGTPRASASPRQPRSAGWHQVEQAR